MSIRRVSTFFDTSLSCYLFFFGQIFAAVFAPALSVAPLHFNSLQIRHDYR